MRLDLPTAGLERYKSASQCARVATEAWGAAHLYCANCSSSRLQRLAVNTPATDYICPSCEARFQLKSQSRPLAYRLADAAYEPMRAAIVSDNTPNLLVLHYLREEWAVWNLILVPQFAFSLHILEKRKPLSPSAKRHGWVGCSLLLGRIPADARIPIVAEGVVKNPGEVRKNYKRLRPLEELSVEKRGWALDVLNVVRSLGKKEFTLPEVYAFAELLGDLHPANRHVREKIRQQLQTLRDHSFLDFLGRGRYRLHQNSPRA